MPARTAPSSRKPRARRQTRSEKLDLRLSREAKRRIRAAASMQSKTISEFVLDSALGTADVLLADDMNINLNPEQWAAFMQALDAPPRYHARLERLLDEPSAFD